jgi:hypothetical protein
MYCLTSESFGAAYLESQEIVEIDNDMVECEFVIIKCHTESHFELTGLPYHEDVLLKNKTKYDTGC